MSIAPAQRLATPAVEKTKTGRRSVSLNVLTGLAAIGFVVGLTFAMFVAGMDATQGNVQRVFYFHLSAFMGAAVAFSAGTFGGIAYLRTHHVKWDTLSLSAVEVGFALSIITLVTGMVWARPTWNTWWTWDPRLTSAAIMVLTYAAYFVFRGALENPERRAQFASVYAILAISTMIFTLVITRIRPDTIHPTVVGPSATNAQGSFSMTPNMGMTLGINITIWMVLITPTLIWWRIRLEALHHRIDQKRYELTTH